MSRFFLVVLILAWFGVADSEAELFDLSAVILRPTPVEPESYFASRLASSRRGVLVGQPRGRVSTSFCDQSNAYEFDVDGQLVWAYSDPNPRPCTFGNSVAAIGPLRFVGRLVAPEDPEAYCGLGGAMDVFDGTESDQTVWHPIPSLALQDHRMFGVSACAGKPRELCIGAPDMSATSPDRGSVIVWNATSGSSRLVIEDPESGWHGFGGALDADARGLIVGASGRNAACFYTLTPNCFVGMGSPCTESSYPFIVGHNYPRPGAAHVFDLTTGTLLHSLVSPTSSSLDGFGQAVAIDEARCAVGAPFDDSVAPDAGVVHVFDSATAEWLYAVQSPQPRSGARFGMSLVAYGGFLFVGEPWYRFDEFIFAAEFRYAKAGAVHVYDLATGAFVETIHNPSYERSGDEFGQNIVVSRNRLFVSSFLEDPVNTGANSGMVWVYDLSGAVARVGIETSGGSRPSAYFGGANVAGGTYIEWTSISQPGLLQACLKDAPFAPAGSSFDQAWRYLWELSFDGVAPGPAEVTIAYDASELAVPESALAVAFHPADLPPTDGWVLLPGVVDPAWGTVTATVPYGLGSIYLTTMATTHAPSAATSITGAGTPYPNPASNRATINFRTTSRGHVRLRILGVDGRLVRTVFDGVRGPGLSSVEWDGRDDGGRVVQPGVYFWSVRGPGLQEFRRISMVR